MAELVGVGISIASLTIQIVESLNKTISFYESIRNAPTDISRIITELQVLSNIISAIQLIHEKPCGIDEVTTKKCLDLVRSDINKLSCLSTSLERKLNSSKIATCTWARVQTVLSENKITKLRSHLKSAMEGLLLLQNCHIFTELRALTSLHFQTPKDLGHCWETGQLEDHVKIDDGSSCGLELHWVEPDVIPFEATDVTLGRSPDLYRDYLLGTRKKKIIQEDPRSALDQATTPVSTGGITNGNPPIDFACRRLIIKWEPLCNIVHRYLYCRCVIRMSTPSYIEKEITVLVLALCPRHNTVDACHRDYGEIDYYQDPYFEQFGGYYSFQYFIYLLKPDIYNVLGGERFLRNDRIKDALKAFDKFREGNDEGLNKANFEYFFEINDKLENVGFKLPDRIAEVIRDERLRRRNERKLLRGSDFSNVRLSEEQRRDFSNAPMTRELNEILAGKWSGRPHWAIEN
ncbi:hypothetical protein V492_02861 [Pseudogymnoascus sp. VKM F-4246]|nr:hypothetical protein V492_02861 [Pseudogymnoascus sp. VKM F-4246]